MGKIVKTYDYVDENGTLLYQNVRYEPKDFRQRRPEGNGGWIPNLNGVRRVLYRLPELLQAPLQDWVCVVEGEKDVASLHVLGFVATTSGNASSWRPEFSEFFKGRLVAVFADNDKAGRRYANAVASSLQGIAAKVRIIEPDGLGEHGDITDWIDEHDSLESGALKGRIHAMIDEAPPFTGNGPEAEQNTLCRIASLAVTRLSDVQPREVVWFWPNRFVDWAFNILSGDPGATKSFLTIFMASIVSRGDCWPDCPNDSVQKGSVLLYSSEDDAGIIRTRLDAHGADPEKVIVCNGVHIGQDAKTFDLNHHLDALERFLDETPDMRLIVLDPVTGYLGKVNANGNAEIQSTLGPLADLATRRKVAIIGINHHNKREDLSFMYRGLGSMGFVAQARSVWAVVEDKDDPDTRIFAPVKANYSIKPSGLKYRIIDGAVVFEPEPWTGRLDDQLKQSTDSKSRVEACAEWLKDRLANGPTLSSTIFEEAPEDGFNRDLCYKAKKLLGIKATKSGFDTGWYWTLKDNGESEDEC